MTVTPFAEVEPVHQPMQKIAAQCCVVGGGPAGMMLGYLLGRAGVRTVVLEKHADFLRDFRGDTVHPSTLHILEQLGLLDDFLQRPHQKLQHLEGWVGKTRVRIADFNRLPGRCNFIAFMPQWEFLNFLAEKARRFTSLQVRMQAEAHQLIRDGENIVGVVAATPQGELEVRAGLVIAADGRGSAVRKLAGLEVENIGAPIDVMWFRIGRDPKDFDQTFTHVEAGNILITIDRGDYWQCAYVIAKGSADTVRARGIEAFRNELAIVGPALGAHAQDIASWDDVKILTVAVNRLNRWSMPGLLCIGDAAHAMSPVGGVGINLAVQDAVAAANLLATRLQKGPPSESELDAVQRRRMFPTRATQALQVQAQNRILAPLLSSTGQILSVPIAFRVLNRVAWLRGVFARVVGLGFRPEQVQSPESS